MDILSKILEATKTYKLPKNDKDMNFVLALKGSRGEDISNETFNTVLRFALSYQRQQNLGKLSAAKFDICEALRYEAIDSIDGLVSYLD